MSFLKPETLAPLWDDFDAREDLLRQIVADRLGANPPPSVPDHVVATYYFAFRSGTLSHAVEEISYHATSGIKNPPKGSLLEQCSARQAGVDAFDSSGRIGLLHVAFPLKMMRHPDGRVTSCDLLHTLAGAVIFDMFENQDARLISIKMPDEVIRTFPGTGLWPDQHPQEDGFRPRSAGVRHDLEADGRHHARRRRAAGRRSGGQPALDVHQGRRRPLSRPRLFAGRRADQARHRGDRAGARPAGRPGPGLFAARLRRARSDRRPGSRRGRRRGVGGDVQRDLRGGHGPDGSRGDQERSRIRRRSTAIMPASAPRPAASGAR